MKNTIRLVFSIFLMLFAVLPFSKAVTLVSDETAVNNVITTGTVALAWIDSTGKSLRSGTISPISGNFQ
jgi:hypothetical protein